MPGIFGADARLQRENARLQRELSREKADRLELQHENTELKEDNARLKALAFGMGGYGEKIERELQNLRGQVQSQGAALERMNERMATRQELDQVKQELQQAIAAETQQVSNDIQALKDQLASGQPITQQDLDDLRASVQAVSQIDPDAAPGARRK